MANNARRNKKSLCEKSMNLVVNIIKVSLFYIVKKSFTMTTRPPLATGNHAPLTGSLPVMDTILAPQIPGYRRSQERKRVSKPYLIDPYEGKGVSYMIREGKNIDEGASEGKNIDGRASDYIRSVHEKNRNDSNNTSELTSFE